MMIFRNGVNIFITNLKSALRQQRHKEQHSLLPPQLFNEFKSFV